MKNYVYLAGSITKHIEKDTLSRAIYWRKVANKMLRECGIKSYDPTLNFIRNKDKNRKDFLQQNNLYLNKSNIMLIDLDYICQSGGTLFELAIAYNKGMVIVSFGDMNNFSEDIFGHFEEIIKSGFNFKTFDEAINYIVDLYEQ
jgi:hypothetical protein